MIKMKELCKLDLQALPKEHIENVTKLFDKINDFRNAYGKPLLVTSGYRTMADHLNIYKHKGITDQSKIPMKSNHLNGLAADVIPIEDDIKHLHDWVLNNIKLCEELGLYFEDFSATNGWLHIQIVAPKSGNMFFKP